jgi:hypothetical protein
LKIDGSNSKISFSLSGSHPVEEAIFCRKEKLGQIIDELEIQVPGIKEKLIHSISMVRR